MVFIMGKQFFFYPTTTKQVIVLLMPQRWLDNWILNLVVKQIFITRAMIDNDAKIFLQKDGVHYGQAVFFLSYYN